MSRTDKDKPSWVRAEWYTPRHRCGSISYRSWNPITKEFGERKTVFRGVCDLPESPNIGGVAWSRPRHNKTRCAWEPEWTDSQVRYVKNKRDWRRSQYWGPQRMRERLASRRIISGDHDTEYPDGRTRHSVLWDLY